jgi:hypothetical protein
VAEVKHEEPAAACCLGHCGAGEPQRWRPAVWEEQSRKDSMEERKAERWLSAESKGERWRARTEILVGQTREAKWSSGLAHKNLVAERDIR